MATRWEVEDSVLSSSLEPTGRHIMLTLLSLTNASTAEIPARHTPSFTELERITGCSRSTLIEWMRLLTESHWASRIGEEGTSRQGMALAVGDSSAVRPKRVRASRAVDGAYRLAVQPPPPAIPPGGTERTAERYGAIPPGGTDEQLLLIKNSPTESSNPTTTLDQATTVAEPPRRRRTKRAPSERPDADEICVYLADAVEAGGSKRPPVSQKWLTEARLLLDEKRTPATTVERVKALIDWIQTSGWWKARVLSMPKLRDRYDEIRLDALRDFDRKKNNQPRSSERGHQPYRNSDDPNHYNDWKAPRS